MRAALPILRPLLAAALIGFAACAAAIARPSGAAAPPPPGRVRPAELRSPAE